MTTPPVPAPPQHPPTAHHHPYASPYSSPYSSPYGYPRPYPLPPARPRHRGAVVAGVVAALLLVLTGGSAAAWWLLRDTDDSPLAGRPRVTDEKAGISYAIPEGWRQPESKGLIDAFTSTINKPRAGDEGAAVLAGRSGPVPESDLKRQAERAARSNAEFFYPDGSSELAESRATTVSHRPAHTVALRVSDGKGGTAHLRLTLIAARDSSSAFLIGLGQHAAPAGDKEVDMVLRSASLT
ncbi:hypothetical protein [Streptomyces sp. NPDC002537]